MLKTLGVYTLVLLITLALLELASRAVFQPLTGKPLERAALQQARAAKRAAGEDAAERLDVLYIFHPYVGYVGRPGARPWGKQWPPFNAYGMLSVPGHAYPYRKAADEFVVAVLGGSVAEGFANLGGEAALQQALQQRAPGFGRRVVLINLATGGYKQPQQLMHLQYALLSGFEFDMVLNLDGLNDVIAPVLNLERGIHPLYPSGVHTGMMAQLYSGPALNRETVARLHEFYALQQRERALLALIDDTPLRHSGFFNLVGELWSQRTDQRIAWLKAGLAEKAQHGLAQDFSGPEASAVDQSAIAALWGQASRLVYATCQAYGLAYLHALQPNQYVPDSKTLSEEERRDAYLPDGRHAELVRAGYPHLVAEGRKLRRRGVPFYDLTGAFENIADTIYLDPCCHFGEAGNRILAERFAEIIAAEVIH